MYVSTNTTNVLPTTAYVLTRTVRLRYKVLTPTDTTALRLTWLVVRVRYTRTVRSTYVLLQHVLTTPRTYIP